VRTDSPSPKVFLNLIADSDERLAGIKYSVGKYNAELSKYEYVGCAKYAAHLESGTLVWDKHVELSECPNKEGESIPVALDLSAIDWSFPLLLTVTAIELDGTTTEIEAKYVTFPLTNPWGGQR
jgi:hypothetical protein